MKLTCFLLLLSLIVNINSRQCKSGWRGVLNDGIVLCLYIEQSQNNESAECQNGVGESQLSITQPLKEFAKKTIVVDYMDKFFTKKFNLSVVKPIIIDTDENFEWCLQMDPRTLNLTKFENGDCNLTAPVYYVCYDKEQDYELNRICSYGYSDKGSPAAMNVYSDEWRCARQQTVLNSFNGLGMYSCNINTSIYLTSTNQSCQCGLKLAWLLSDRFCDCSTGNVSIPRINFDDSCYQKSWSFKVENRSSCQQMCAVNVTWNDMCIYDKWSEFGSCSKECGIGNKIRTRTVEKDYPFCVEKHTEESAKCYETNGCTSCQIYYVGSNWSSCSAMCNGGSQSRKINDIIKGLDTQNICKDLTPGIENTRFCYNNRCLENCTASDWSAWSNCSAATCGDGYKIRRREIFNNDSLPCNYNNVDNETCYGKFRECPKNCTYSNWTDWTRCPKCREPNAPVHYKNRTRVIMDFPSTYGGKCNYSSLLEKEKCEHKECTDDEELTEEEKDQLIIILPVIFGGIVFICLVTCTVVVFNTRKKSDIAKRRFSRGRHLKHKDAKHRKSADDLSSTSSASQSGKRESPDVRMSKKKHKPKSNLHKPSSKSPVRKTSPKSSTSQESKVTKLSSKSSVSASNKGKISLEKPSKKKPLPHSTPRKPSSKPPPKWPDHKPKTRKPTPKPSTTHKKSRK